MVTIRPGLPGDIDAIAAIHTHYVLNTVLAQPTSMIPHKHDNLT
jgi:L-amino acid N-acyltransferase YncA